MTNSINGQNGNKSVDYWNAGADQVLDLLADKGRKIAEQRAQVSSQVAQKGMDFIDSQAGFIKDFSKIAESQYKNATLATKSKKLWRYATTMGRESVVTKAAGWAGSIANAVTGVGDALVALDSDRQKGDKTLSGFMQSAMKSTTQSVVGMGAGALVVKAAALTLGTAATITSAPAWVVGGAIIGGGIAAYKVGNVISSYFDSAK